MSSRYRHKQMGEFYVRHIVRSKNAVQADVIKCFISYPICTMCLTPQSFLSQIGLHRGTNTESFYFHENTWAYCDLLCFSANLRTIGSSLHIHITSGIKSRMYLYNYMQTNEKRTNKIPVVPYFSMQLSLAVGLGLRALSAFIHRETSPPDTDLQHALYELKFTLWLKGDDGGFELSKEWLKRGIH